MADARGPSRPPARREHRLTRKVFLRVVGAAGAGWTLGLAGWSDQPSAERARRERIARLLREYDAQGNHRTGSEVDDRSGRWLADQVREAGLEPALESFPFSKIDIRSAHVEVGERRAEGLPLFDGGFTDADGVVGRLGSADGDAPIGLTRAGPSLGGLRRSGRHRALVVVTGGTDAAAPGRLVFRAPAGLVLANAGAYRDPFGPPVLQVPTDAGVWLSRAADEGRTARVVAHVARRDVSVFNVTAVLEGRRPELAPLVVMTPRSGWWSCASERGGGLAIWVELMRELKALGPARPVHFVASTGHELGHDGLKHYLQQRQALIAGAGAWIHLGANLGAAVRGDGPRLLQVSDAGLQEVARRAMAGRGVTADELPPPGTAPIGEAARVHEGGGRYVSVIGSNALFHHPHDRWPAAVDVDEVARLAEAFADLAAVLSGPDIPLP